MVYNPQNAKEEPALPADTIFEGAIIDLKDGKIKDFVTSDKWKGDKEGAAIHITIEVLHKNQSYKFSQVFAYREEEGKTLYGPNSALGKFKKKYDELPGIGVKIKCLTNKDGFLRLKLD